MKNLIKQLNPFKHKPKFTFGEKDNLNLRKLFIDGKETNIKIYEFSEYEPSKLNEIAKELYEQKRF